MRKYRASKALVKRIATQTGISYTTIEVGSSTYPTVKQLQDFANACVADAMERARNDPNEHEFGAGSLSLPG